MTCQCVRDKSHNKTDAHNVKKIKKMNAICFDLATISINNSCICIILNFVIAFEFKLY